MKRIDLRSSPFGFKVSAPGFDVDTAVGKQLLMNISDPTLMVIAAGRVTLTASVPLVVPWPFTLPDRPVIDIQRSQASGTVNLVPYRNNSEAYTRVSWVVTTSQVTFTATGDCIVTYVAVTRETL